MALQFLHKVVEELVLDIVCRNGEINLARLGEQLKNMLGRSPKTLLDLKVCFEGSERIKQNLPTSLLPFVRNAPFLLVSGTTVTLSSSDDGQNAFTAWKTSENLGVVKYRRDVLKDACRILFDSLSAGTSPNRMKDTRGNTLLHLVAGLPSNNAFFDLNNKTYLTLLLRNGADLRILNNDNFTPLHIVTRRSMVNGKAPARMRPEAWPSENRCKQLKVMTSVQIFSEDEFESCMKVRGRNGNNILHEWVLSSITAVHKQDELELGDLILSLGVLPDARNDEGCTPLHYACDADVFKFLFQRRVHERHNNEGDTPLLSVIKRGIVDGNNRDKLLQPPSQPEDDAKSPIEDIIAMVSAQNHNLIARNHNGNHAIDVLMKSLMPGVYPPMQISHVCRTLKSLAEILSAEVLNKENVDATTIVEELLDCIESIYNHPQRPEVEPVDVYPLLIMIDKLLDHVVRESNVTTLLHKCCRLECLPSAVAAKLIRILRTHGADPDVKDSQGQSPRQVLQQRGVGISLIEALVNTRSKRTVRVELKTKVHEKALRTLCASSPRVVDCYRYNPSVCIGVGAIGRVFPAIDEKGKREVALKRIQKNYHEKAVATEIEALCKLTKYEQVVDYYAIVDSQPDFYFIVLELMEGDLADLIEFQKQALTDSSTMAKLVGDMVNGLNYLHSQPGGGILHRDLKPGNVLYTDIPDLRLKIADFGLAKDTTGYSTLTTTMTTGHSLAGTRGWMAPELVSREQKGHTMESDVFSLGLVCHFLMSKGKHPFDPRGTMLTKQAARGVIPHELEVSIIDGELSLDKTLCTFEGRHLLRKILVQTPQERPTVNWISEHCFFWSTQKKIQFLMAVGDQKEVALSSKHVASKFNLILEAMSLGRRIATSSPWNQSIPGLYHEMTSAWVHKKYNITSLVDLVRFFRNAYAHEEERSSAQKAGLMSNVFFEKFPSLLLTVWATVLQAAWDKPQHEGDRQRIQRALLME